MYKLVHKHNRASRHPTGAPTAKYKDTNIFSKVSGKQETTVVSSSPGGRTGREGPSGSSVSTQKDNRTTTKVSSGQTPKRFTELKSHTDVEAAHQPGEQGRVREDTGHLSPASPVTTL